MAFIAPFIAAGIGLTGTAAVIGEAIIGIGLSFGVSYLARKLQPKPSTAPSAQGMQLSVGYDANGPRQFAFGTCASAGSLVYHNTYGPNGNDYLQLVFKLADLPCDTITGLYVDGVAVNLGGNFSDANVSGNTVTQYPNVLWVKYHDGAYAQAVDADLNSKSTGGEWSSTFTGHGVCYNRFTAKYDPEKFKNGRPSFLTVFKGALLYDFRLDSTNGGSGAHRWGSAATYEWTDNPAVILYNYMRGLLLNGAKVGGMNVPSSSLPVTEWTAAANACDELVAKKAGGTEKRYRANGIWNLDGEHATFIRDILATMAGTLVDAGGVFKLYAGVARSSVLTLTDADLISDEPVTFSPRMSRSGLVNAVFGSFTDPANFYQNGALPPRISPSDAVSDGGNELTENYGLQYVTSATQGQRVLEIYRRRGRYQRTLSLKARASCVVLEAGDWITFNSERYGFSSVTFEVVQATSARDLTTSLELREVAAGIYTWTAASDELDPLSPATVGAGGARFTTVQNVILANITVTGAGAQQRPGLHITWDAIDDPTVVNLALEYRRVGDTVPQKFTILEPSDGSFTWTAGIQGGIQYEARLKPITIPVRGVAFTGWVGVGADSVPQVVAIADIATAVPPDTITPAMLSPQARFMLELTTAVDTVLGSISQVVNETQRQADAAHLATINALLDADEAKTLVRVESVERNTEDLALAQIITTLQSTLNNDVAAALLEEQTARTTADSALASDITTALTRVGDNESSVTTITEALNGIEAKFGIAVNLNGQIVGLFQLDGSAVAGSTFTVVADNFKVARPGAGGAAVPVFGLATVNGVSRLALRGDMIADGAIFARHLSVVTLSALAANLGTITAGLMRDAANTYYFNLNNGRLGTTDGDVLFDLKNKTFRMAF